MDLAISKQNPQRDRLIDTCFRGLTRLCAWTVLALVAGIIVTLVIGAWPALKTFGFDFLGNSNWQPFREIFGAKPAIYGTLVSSFIALCFGVPISFGIALFVTELAPGWLRRPISTAVELLAAIPSIIYGMWGLFVLAPLLANTVQPWLINHVGGWPLIGPLFSGPPIGIGIFTAGLILAIMITPFITAVMKDVFNIVPAIQKESAYALGATTWEVMRSVVLPWTRTGVIGGTMLGLGRALGETMAVTFVIGNAHRISSSLFMPSNTISSAIANEFNEATGSLHVSSLFTLGLVLFAITFMVLTAARLLLIWMEARK